MSRRTDIILLCQYFEPDVAATGVVLTEVAEDLVCAGYTVECVTAQPSYARSHVAPERETLRGVRVRRLSTGCRCRKHLAGRLAGGLSYILGASWHVWRADHSATLLISTSPPYLGLLGLWARLFFRQRYVYVVHDIYPEIARRLGFFGRRSVVAACWCWLERQVLCHASAIIVQGRDMQAVLRAKLPSCLRDRVQVIPLGADPHRVYPLKTDNGGFRHSWANNGELVALYAGNMGACHDLETILEAASLLEGEPIRFVLSGDGIKRERLEKLAKARRLHNVTFHNYIPPEQLNDLLAACDVGLVAIDRAVEGLLVPWKAYNLMAAGKPVLVVASDQCETGKTIIAAKCGALVAQGRGDQLAKWLRTMCRDRSALEAMGAAGRQYLVANLSREHRATLFAAALKTVRGAPAPPARPGSRERSNAATKSRGDRQPGPGAV